MSAFYPWIKSVHLGTAAFTSVFFLVRLGWMYRSSPLLQRRWVRVLPHVNDSLLLASGVTMAVWLRQYPLIQPWLTAKLAALLLYILFGTLALKRARTRKRRLLAGIFALLCLSYIFAVALTRSPGL